MEGYSVKIGKCCNCKKDITKMGLKIIKAEVFTKEVFDKIMKGDYIENAKKEYESFSNQNQRKGQWLWNKIWDKVVDKAKRPESEKDILENEQLVSHHLWTMKDSEFDEMMSKRVDCSKILKLIDEFSKKFDVKTLELCGETIEYIPITIADWNNFKEKLKQEILK